MNGRTARRGQMAIVVSAVGYGVGTALSVVALRGLRPADLLAIELAGSATVLLTVAAITGRLRRDGAGRALAQGAVLPGLTFLLGDLGLARTTATSGALLLSADTIATVLLSALVLRERLRVVEGAALTVGTAGTVLVALYASPTDPAMTPETTTGPEMLGNLLVLASVLAGAGFVVWSRRTAGAADGDVGRTAWQFLGATLAVLPFVLGSWGTGGSRVLSAGPGTLVAAGAVLLCGLVGLLAFNVGIDEVSASRAGLLFTVQPLAGALTAVVAVGEPLVEGQAIGGALILVCLVLLARDGSGDHTGPSPTIDDTDTPAAAAAVCMR